MQDSLFNFNELSSMRVCLSLRNIYKGAFVAAVAVISNFHHRRPHGGPNSGPFDKKKRYRNILMNCYQ